MRFITKFKLENILYIIIYFDIVEYINIHNKNLNSIKLSKKNRVLATFTF